LRSRFKIDPVRRKAVGNRGALYVGRHRLASMSRAINAGLLQAVGAKVKQKPGSDFSEPGLQAWFW